MGSPCGKVSNSVGRCCDCWDVEGRRGKAFSTSGHRRTATDEGECGHGVANGVFGHLLRPDSAGLAPDSGGLACFFPDVASSHDKIERLVFRSMHFCLGVETFGAIVKGTGFSLSGFDCGAGLIAKPTGFLFGVGVLSGAIYGLSGSNPAIPCIAQWTANMQATIKVHLVYLCCWMKNMEHVF